MRKKTSFSNQSRSSEEVVSMFLGLVVVVVIAGLVFNYFQKRRGMVDIPGITDQKNVDLGDSFNQDLVKMENGKNIYTVKQGDSLWKIAEAKYGSGYNWVDIAKENNLSNPGLLSSGQRLVLPVVEVKKLTATVDKIQAIDTDRYIVVKGDNLWEICVRAYGDGYKWVEVWNSNKNSLRDPNKLEIGMELILPRVK